MTVLSPALGRAYFLLQAVAGAVWWAAVATVPAVREATLGGVPPLPMAVLDVPLFVLTSALVAAGRRRAVHVLVPWILLITLVTVVYATVTGRAGWGAVLMIASATASIGAAGLVLHGRLPGTALLKGPLGFRLAPAASTRTLLFATAAQIVVFWSLFLLVIPVPIALLEQRWGVHLALPALLRVLGAVAIVPASALGLWSAVTMTRLGEGTPLPAAMPHRLVVAGPYRWVRNPMAVAGISQGVGVGLALSSWAVVAYSVAGGLIWHLVVRPEEEADLAARFGADYSRYRAAVRTWLPRLRPVPASAAGAETRDRPEPTGPTVQAASG